MLLHNVIFGPSRGLLLAAVGACLLLGASAVEVTTAAAAAADTPTAVGATSTTGAALEGGVRGAS